MLRFPNHDTSCHDLGILEKLSMSKGAFAWFEIVGVRLWKLLIIEPFLQ
jgi:hypothetical protein